MSFFVIDFILFWLTDLSLKEDYSKFVQQYPLFGHPASSGFITNFVCPKLWNQMDSPLIKSMLAQSGVFYTIGCHPHFATDLITFKKIVVLERLICSKNEKMIAIGECGLDKSSKNKAKMIDQIEVFKFQIILAMKTKKPLVLHIRGAEKEALDLLEMLPRDWPIHR